MQKMVPLSSIVNEIMLTDSTASHARSTGERNAGERNRQTMKSPMVREQRDEKYTN